MSCLPAPRVFLPPPLPRLVVQVRLVKGDNDKAKPADVPARKLARGFAVFRTQVSWSLLSHSGFARRVGGVFFLVGLFQTEYRISRKMTRPLDRVSRLGGYSSSATSRFPKPKDSFSDS